MAEGTYEFECMRAELLGIEIPDREKFELENADRLKAEADAREADEANELEAQDESLKKTHGKLDELNHILSATQQKINMFKRSAAGSLSNIFRTNSVDEASSSNDHPEPPLSESKNSESEDINDARENLEQTKTDITVAKTASLDIQKKMTSHLDKLDSLINKADTAELSMAAQTKQMKKFTK